MDFAPAPGFGLRRRPGEGRLTVNSHFADLPASAWVARWAPLIRPGGEVLDVACGSGRHARFLAAQGFEVLAVDRDPGLFPDPPAGRDARRGRPRGGPLALPGTPVRRDRRRQLPAPAAPAGARRFARAGRGAGLRDLRPRQRALRPALEPGFPAGARASCWSWRAGNCASSPTRTWWWRRPARRPSSAFAPAGRTRAEREGPWQGGECGKISLSSTLPTPRQPCSPAA